jgi:pimeloyl-ACP methyl ester carboxylesterase
VPRIPEILFTTAAGKKLLEFTCGLLEGHPGKRNMTLLGQMLSCFHIPNDMRGPINYYRQLVLWQLLRKRRATLNAVYQTPIAVPTTLIWGQKDRVLSESVARRSYLDAGCPVDFRILPDVGHFGQLEASLQVANEIRWAITSA